MQLRSLENDLSHYKIRVTKTDKLMDKSDAITPTPRVRQPQGKKTYRIEIAIEPSDSLQTDIGATQ